MKFGISLVGKEWGAMEGSRGGEKHHEIHAMMLLTHACVATWTACIPVSRRAVHRVQGVPPLASDVLNSALDSSLTQIKSLNFGPSLCLGIHFTIEKWGQ